MKAAGRRTLGRNLLILNFLALIAVIGNWYGLPGWLHPELPQAIDTTVTSSTAPTPFENVQPAEIRKLPPLEALAVTRQRPLFSALRMALPEEKGAELAPMEGASLLDDYTIAGIVIAGKQSLVMLKPRQGGKTIRLRQGDTFNGWVLRTVQDKEIKFTKESAEVVFPTRPE